ncbi:hypothetical protein IFM89_038795 [Coptis chinensis]|uniref:DNA (cytosine-5-)-methyltransferase n=1 Tax=Coptis chinensis TaxID=261450 RepID=A0A835IZM5_9MAGN|nr:hypothetical protein IFM89_038795 [Coptis chinensis]
MGDANGEGSDDFHWDSEEETPSLPLVPAGEFHWDSDEEVPECVASTSCAVGNLGEESDRLPWDSDEEEEIRLRSSSFLNSIIPLGPAVADPGEASSSAGPSCSKLVSEFVVMGFSRDMVTKAIQENGEGNAEAILETLLTYSALNQSPAQRKDDSSDFSSSESTKDIHDELSDMESDLGNEEFRRLRGSWRLVPHDSHVKDNAIIENMDPLVEKENTLKQLVDMGYPMAEASIAMDRCGSHDFNALTWNIKWGHGVRDWHLDGVIRMLDALEGISRSCQLGCRWCKGFALSGGNFSSHSYYKLPVSNIPYLPQATTPKDLILSLACGVPPKVHFFYGPDASVSVLIDFISAAQMAKAADAYIARPTYPSSNGDEIRRSHISLSQNKKRRTFKEEGRPEKKLWGRSDDGETVCLPNPMIGFGLPSEPRPIFRRTLPEAAVGPPYFYYENVALAPKGVWQSISRFLYEIEPEFVDSKYFSAACRKRGYIHNLPIDNRIPLLPIPPQTIHEAFPSTKKWWPSWDQRTKLNCVQTCTASAKLTERIRKSLEDREGDPPLEVQKYVINECKKWNLVWVGKNKAAPLEPDEMESLLGFPKDHTRGGGISRTERLRGLGNSFQVDTVAFHLSVLKNIFPNGINVLSLFSGIGGAEVALHRLGIPLKNVVSVEISESSRNILRSWWESTSQKGNLIDVTDVQLLDAEKLEQFVNAFGGFDLLIGGSPCNNISGSNRRTRDGLEGKHSSLFFDYFRILNQVKIIMEKS